MKGYNLFMDVSGDVMADIAKGEVQLLPMEFEIGNDEYVYTDGNDGMDPVEFYKFVKQGVPMKTSQITPSLFENYFEETLKEGYSALYLCLSSGLSSTYESACHAAECLKRKYPEVDLVPVDSLTATVGMGLLCERMIKNKKEGLSVWQNRDDLLSARSRLTTTGVVDDLNTLKRGGRISSAVAVIGGLLNFKPIVLVQEDGTLKMSATARGTKKALKHLFDLYCETHDENVDEMYVMHADEQENASALCDMLKAKFPQLNVRMRLLSPIIGAHLGKGLVGVGFYKKTV